MIALLTAAAMAATLPGVPVPFDIDEQQRWVLPDELPPTLSDAGAMPGWVLVEVDGLPFEDAQVVMRRVAAGPARDIQLRFDTAPEPEEGDEEPEEAAESDEEEAAPTEVIMVAHRIGLVHVELIETVDWPAEVAMPVGSWLEDWASLPVLRDADGGSWLLDIDTGSMLVSAGGDWSDAEVPEVFWNLSGASWALDIDDEITVTDSSRARALIGTPTRVESWRGRVGDHLLVQKTDGVQVLRVSWPGGTATLPTCRQRVPETCLASGTRILHDLGSLPGAHDEALRHLGLACANGVNRACYETVALQDEAAAPRVQACLDGDLPSCNAVAGERLRAAPEGGDDLVIGLLEYACEVEGSGTLGERIRRLEDVGAGCMGLAEAYDARGMPDQALLNLDQACVLGRADACEEAADWRHQAYALRTVRECEDPDVPIAVSCVELGKLLQLDDVPVATVDDFSAFLRGCSLGATEGCVLLGDYVDRWGIEHTRVASAESELKAACSQGEQRACLGAAHLLVRHDPRSAAYGEALVLFSTACTEGLADGCVAGAEQRRINAARKVDVPDQLQMWVRGCDLNDPDGCAGLGVRQARSKQTWPDAYSAWTRACDLGDAHSCSELGQLVMRTHDPMWTGEQPSDSYLTRGCDNGDPEGCFWLAEDDLPSKGEPPEAAYVLLDRSCEGSYGPGCASLAAVHLDRRTNFDDEIAARHLDSACDYGHFESCRSLGTMYLRGKGVERDRQRAKELFDRFRLNAKRRHLRIGPTVGMASVAGLELEAVLPIPVGPALSVGGTYSFIPGGGSALVILDGEDSPNKAPDLQVLQASARVYANPQGRGMYGALGFHQLTAQGGSSDDRSRAGLNARLGLRSQTGITYSNLEIGFGNYGVLDLNDFDADETGQFPLILPTFSFGFGLALL